ncbi:MAG: hypothetical protein HYX28_07870 [Candidatus Koribacter versatilis]|uniref:Uncharacterized protein n=1 Tax=Candidatus Korobacter versatilis TaxID=658062 RepID=A0A932A8L4_9BACT|nr:hypothetical protein [Candidatus Koribacter versatilis]
MTTAAAPAQLTEIAAQWRSARQLYPVYAAVVRQYGIAIEPSRDLEYPVDRSEPEAIERIEKWFAEADAKIEVWQLRQVLQTSELGSEPVLRALIGRILAKEKRTEADRDKADFLLAQYFFHCAPVKMHQGEPTLDDMAEVLEPVLGESIPEAPAWLGGLDTVIANLRGCETLRDLLERGILAHARKLKTDAGDMFFGSGAMLTFTRFNFLVRGTFVRLIHNDLHAIRFALHELEQRGQRSFDCSAAGLGKSESGEHLRLFCHDWKTTFRAAYSSGQPFQQLIQLRTALEAALAAPPPQVAQPGPVAAAVEEPVPVEVPPAPKVIAPVAKVPAAVPLAKEAKAMPGAPSAAAVQKEMVAAYKAEPKLTLAKAAPKPIAIGGKPAPTPAPADVDGYVEQIAEQLLKDSAKTGTAVTAVVVAGHKLMLSSWEVAAFVQGGDDVSDALQRAVGARALLSRMAEERRQGTQVEVAPVLAAAHAEAAALQAQIAQAKEQKNIDGAVNLSASARRLIGLMEELESGPKPPQRSAQ